MKPVPRLLCASLALLAAASVGAQPEQPEQRDPTAWPAALRQSLASAQAASAAAPAEPQAAAARHILVRDGRSLLISQGRSYGVGDLLDGARIQRIDERGVWLLEAGKLRQEPLYPGVDKREPASAAASSPAATRPRAKNSKEKP
jgi:hypothetical protein